MSPQRTPPPTTAAPAEPAVTLLPALELQTEPPTTAAPAPWTLEQFHQERLAPSLAELQQSNLATMERVQQLEPTLQGLNRTVLDVDSRLTQMGETLRSLDSRLPPRTEAVVAGLAGNPAEHEPAAPPAEDPPAPAPAPRRQRVWI